MTAKAKPTERDLRDIAKAIREGRVERNIHDRDIVKTTVWRSIRRGRPGNWWVERVADVRQTFCFVKTSLLEEQGYAVLGDDRVWSLTKDGEAWLDGFSTATPVEVRMREKEIDG